jgi:AhpD family alkylhydroperoxidase
MIPAALARFNIVRFRLSTGFYLQSALSMDGLRIAFPDTGRSMARIPYADTTNPAISKLVGDIAAQRGAVPHLYKMLLNAPAVAEGWLNYLTAIRQRCSLPAALRELVIIRIAIVNGAPYEADQHRPIALKLGISEQQLDALAQWESSTVFDDTQRKVLTYCDTMTKSVQVPDATFKAVQDIFTPAEMVELTATIAAYNMVSRFLEALQIHSGDEKH